MSVGSSESRRVHTYPTDDALRSLLTDGEKTAVDPPRALLTTTTGTFARAQATKRAFFVTRRSSASCAVYGDRVRVRSAVLRATRSSVTATIFPLVSIDYKTPEMGNHGSVTKV